MNLPELNKTMIPWIGRTGLMVRLFFSDRFKKYDWNLTFHQWLLMRFLHEKDGQTQTDLAVITQRNKASLARLVSNMEKKNLVARIPSKEDKRVNKVCLTTKGKKVFEDTLSHVHKIIEELQAGITEEEVQTVIGILIKIQENTKKN